MFDFMVSLTALIGCVCWLGLFWDLFRRSCDD